MGNGGPDPRNQPLGCGVAVTDWRTRLITDISTAAGTRTLNDQSRQKSLNRVGLNVVWRVVCVIETWPSQSWITRVSMPSLASACASRGPRWRHHSSIWRASLVVYLSRPAVLDHVDAHSLHRPQW